MAQSSTSKQEGQIVRFVVDAAESATKSAVAQADFLGKDVSKLVIRHLDVLKAEIERAVIDTLKKIGSQYPLLTETSLLKPVTKATVPARTKPFNAAEFYQIGPGLYVYDTFTDRLDVNARQTVDSAPERPYVALLLKVSAYDTDIRKELPEIHLSTLEDIAGLIEAQPNGKSGLLLSNGYANIFYIEGRNGEVFAVSVVWSSDDYREWNVVDWQLDEIGSWLADYQVLCPGNASL